MYYFAHDCNNLKDIIHKDVFTISFIMSFLGDNVIMCLTKVSLENQRGLAYTPVYYTHMSWFIKNDKNLTFLGLKFD